ncbi:hypothetical protein AaE_013807 [Aphanomyces astaci]|uniref:Uncharacterized protein n=1 Tax=Aphanomyces astaci TaxID=112090 RepID=A0A6A4Z5X8_APHAT|nr:hypothetical protein AaE_013807 [Aphanomyces astaci]
MAAKQGKVFSGEDDESDEEEDEYDPPSWSTAPVSNPVAMAPSINVSLPPSMKDVTPTNTHVPDTLPDDGDVARLSNASIHDDLAASSSFPVHVRPPPAPSILPEVPPSSAHDDMWTSRLKGEWTEETGLHKMGLAGASHLHSVLEGTLHQITELAESQEVQYIPLYNFSFHPYISASSASTVARDGAQRASRDPSGAHGRGANNGAAAVILSKSDPAETENERHHNHTGETQKPSRPPASGGAESRVGQRRPQ